MGESLLGNVIFVKLSHKEKKKKTKRISHDNIKHKSLPFISIPVYNAVGLRKKDIQYIGIQSKQTNKQKILCERRQGLKPPYD